MKKPKEYSTLLRSMLKEWKWLMRFVVRYRWEIIFYIIVGMIGIAMGLGSSVASKYLIDAVVGKNNETIVTSAALVIGLAISQIVVNAGSSRIATKIGTRINNEIRGSIYERIVLARWSDISGYHSGELINRLEGDVTAVSGAVISFVPGVFTRLTQFLGCLVIVLYYDPTMVIFALMSAPFMLLSSRFTAKMMRKFNLQSREMNGKVLSYGEESMQNLQTIKAFDLTRKYTENFKKLLENYRKLRLDYDKFSIILTTCMSFVGLLVSYSCYGWGVYRLWQGAITYGTMTLFLQMSGLLTSSFSSLVSLAPSAISIATAAGRVMEIVELPCEKDEDRVKAEAMKAAAREKGVTVTAENVSFTYADGDKPVVEKINFCAAPGETIALVGPSGEGKTTILRLILGLIEPDSGEMKMSVDNSDTIKISDSTRRFCSYVPQGSAVFNGTIADNLRIVRADITDEEITEALKTADAWSFVEKLPDGINTVIGERGVNFSEGQIQRISIARALVCDARVLVMDEATSALDEATETRVLKRLMLSDPKRTCIITTHRPSMLKYCNRIYRLGENGSLVLEKSEE